MTNVLQKAAQVGWVYGVVPKPRFDEARWESLVTWMRSEAAKRRGFIKELATRSQINDSSVHYYLKGGRPSPKSLEALENCAASLGWAPNVKVEVRTRDQVAAAKAAQARLEADGKELEERMLCERLLKKYPDIANCLAKAA